MTVMQHDLLHQFSESVALRFPFPECCRREYTDATKGIQDQQILITTHDGGALACQRRRQHDIIVAVTTHRGLERIGYDQGERLSEQSNGGPHVDRALVEFAGQHVAQLIQQRSGRNHDVVADAVLEKIVCRRSL
jgi:hypothetical protein